MEFLTESMTHIPEILSAVVMVLGSLKGYDMYQRKKHSNGSHDRRSNTFAESDKVFIRDVISDQTEKMGLEMRNDRLELMIGLKEVVQTEGEKTRNAVRMER